MTDQDIVSPNAMLMIFPLSECEIHLERKILPMFDHKTPYVRIRNLLSFPGFT